MQCVELCNSVATLVLASASNAVNARTSESSRKSIRLVSNSAAVPLRIAGTLALSLATATKHAHFAINPAMSSAVTGSAQRSAASHVLHALRRHVHLAARTLSAVCLVPLPATGFHVRSAARSCWLAATNARPSAALTVRVRSIVRPAVLTLSKTSELI
jgi:hypothetical protein